MLPAPSIASVALTTRFIRICSRLVRSICASTGSLPQASRNVTRRPVRRRSNGSRCSVTSPRSTGPSVSTRRLPLRRRSDTMPKPRSVAASISWTREIARRPSHLLGEVGRAPVDDREHAPEVVRDRLAGAPEQLEPLRLFELVSQCLELVLGAIDEIGLRLRQPIDDMSSRLRAEIGEHQHGRQQRQLGELDRRRVTADHRPGDERRRDRRPHSEPHHEPSIRQHERRERQHEEDDVEPHHDRPRDHGDRHRGGAGGIEGPGATQFGHQVLLEVCATRRGERVRRHPASDRRGAPMSTSCIAL